MSLDNELKAAGWKYDGLGRFPVSRRAKYIKPGWRILGSTGDFEHWTVQRMRGSSVDWYVDFPKQAGVQAMLVFIMQVELET